MLIMFLTTKGLECEISLNLYFWGILNKLATFFNSSQNVTNNLLLYNIQTYIFYIIIKQNDYARFNIQCGFYKLICKLYSSMFWNSTVWNFFFV